MPGSRCGFIANEIDAVKDDKWNLTTWVDGTNPAIMALNYDRLVVPLWSCCRTLLERVEALEASAKKKTKK